MEFRAMSGSATPVMNTTNLEDSAGGSRVHMSHCMPVIGGDLSSVPSLQAGNSSI